MSDHLILDGDHGGTTFKIVEDHVCTVHIHGVHGDYLTELTTSGKLKIVLAYIQSNKNKLLYSKEMKDEKEFDFLLDKPIELKETERLQVDYPKTDEENTFNVFLSYDLLQDGRITHSVRKQKF